MVPITVEDIYGNTAMINPTHIVMVESVPTEEQLKAQYQIEVDTLMKEGSSYVSDEAAQRRIADMQEQAMTLVGIVRAGGKTLITTSSRLVYVRTERGYVDQALISALEG